MLRSHLNKGVKRSTGLTYMFHIGLEPTSNVDSPNSRPALSQVKNKDIRRERICVS
jgi:hypothetical protein